MGLQGVSAFHSQTGSFMCPRTFKSRGLKSGDRGGQFSDIRGQFSDQESVNSGAATKEAEEDHIQRLLQQSKCRVRKIRYSN